MPNWESGSVDGSPSSRAALKEKCESSRPLGLVQAAASELLVVYEGSPWFHPCLFRIPNHATPHSTDFGCFITKYGQATRKNGFVNWESKIYGYVSREPNILLIGKSAIEVRHIPTGRLLQIIEGREIRLVQSRARGKGPILIARRGTKDDAKGMSDQLVELIETAPLTDQTSNDFGVIWDEWGVEERSIS